MNRSAEPAIKQGFTLVEVLVSSAILALIFAGLFTMFRLGRFGWSGVVEREETAQAYRSTVDRLYMDLKNSFPYASGDCRFNGTSSKLSFYSLVDTHTGSGVTAAYARLTYAVRDAGEGRDGDGLRGLVRSCARNADAVRQDVDPEFVPLAGEYKNLEFSYGQFRGQDHGWNWTASWQNATAMPDAVKLSMTRRDARSFERILYVR